MAISWAYVIGVAIKVAKFLARKDIKEALSDMVNTGKRINEIHSEIKCFQDRNFNTFVNYIGTKVEMEKGDLTEILEKNRELFKELISVYRKAGIACCGTDKNDLTKKLSEADKMKVSAIKKEILWKTILSYGFTVSKKEFSFMLERLVMDGEL